MTQDVNRRGFLACSFSASAGLVAGLSLEEKILLAAENSEGGSPTTILEPAADPLPTGKIRHVEMSRLILGGNLIAGVAHARDLRYVSNLVSSYFTDEKILDTWEIAEKHGVDTMSAWPSKRMLGLLARYRSERGGKIQWLGHTRCDKPFTAIKTCIDNGAVGIYIAGDDTEMYFKTGRLDELAEALSLIKQNGLIAGIACHALAVPKAFEDAKIDVDFYMKTLHSGDYWSATPPDQREHDVRVLDPGFVGKDGTSGKYHDNIWCLHPEETVEYMKTVQKPWMAFKVLAAGSIQPRQGFSYAFRHGADFLHVGMFDFQIAQDCDIARRLLTRDFQRDRPWHA